MKIEEKTILWKPVSEYTGGRVLATNGLDILVGELNPEGDCVSEDCSGIHLCGITHFAKIAGFFPELKESEDERIRNQIINFIEEYGNPIHCEWQKDWIAWLEKQGEQKPTDKVKPKFNVGDWVVWQDKCYKVNYNGCGYELVDQNGLSTSLEYGTIDENAHLWTINDAKPGDVLACNNGWTCIFKTLVNDETFSSYCFMDNTKWFCETGSECHTLKEEFVKAYNGKIYPATKEQRDLLFQKMKEAGYEWNAEKKELKKIDNEEYNGEDYGIDSLYHAQRILEKTLGKVDGYQSDDGILEHKCAITAIKKLYEQKPAEWSEKDKDNIQRALYYVDYYQTHEADTKEAEECFDWLKSLKPQNHWKPTEAQLASLRIACDRNDRVGFDLTQLLKELKEL